LLVPRHVYIHVPFCGRRCSYCDFAIAVRRSTPVAEYLHALGAELLSADPAVVDTIYFGGGTPSRLGGEGVKQLLEIVTTRYRPEGDAEITLESNPDDVTPAAATAWREAGVNRLSLGVQSFDDGVLRWMHRTHDSETAQRAVGIARDAGIANVSLDLIFALPANLQRDWSRDLDTALSLSPDHVSLYGLTVEPSTPLGRWRDRGIVSEAPDESYETEYLRAHSTLSSAGHEHYEVSNFAIPGRQSRHNSAYWAGRPYAGHGPSAHRFDGMTRSWNEPAYARWVGLLLNGGAAEAGRETLTSEQRRLEAAYLGLRTRAGVPLASADRAIVERWVEAGWAAERGDDMVLTAAGWLRLDALVSSLTEHGSPCNV
jgi:oxygen-independent coproporphyrinogen III oxidase